MPGATKRDQVCQRALTTVSARACSLHSSEKRTEKPTGRRARGMSRTTDSGVRAPARAALHQLRATTDSRRLAFVCCAAGGGTRRAFALERTRPPPRPKGGCERGDVPGEE